jgi:rhamnose transport system ATP-binding protein
MTSGHGDSTPAAGPPEQEQDPVGTAGLEPCLRAEGISKAYAGVQALREVSLDLRAGEVHAIVGENGAGKSTLIKILTGAVQPDAGTLSIRGAAVSDHGPLAARDLGIAVVYQQPTLFPHLTVAENLALGLERGSTWRQIDWAARRRNARALIARAGAEIDPDRPASELSMAEQQLVEIARALGSDARIVIMDEPTAALPAHDVARLLAAVREMRARGAGVLYITHRLDEVFELADRITVLRDGSRVDTRETCTMDRSTLISLMVGREMSAIYSHESHVQPRDALEIRKVACHRTGVRDVTFSVRAGEIVGLSGLVGAGRTELARTLFGLSPADEGEIRVDGAIVSPRTPREAIAHGIAYVPEDRRRHGVIGTMPVRTNVTLASLPQLADRLAVLGRSRERKAAERYVRELGIRPASVDLSVSSLSGGNQQKVALARWLMTAPRVLILDEPTQGVDVGAKADVHREMDRLAREGVAILMISSDLQEVLAMSDRVVVMRRGTVAGILERHELASERVLRLALGEDAA